jgi:hypothetical protein
MLDDPLRHLIAYPTEEEAENDLEGALDELEAENNPCTIPPNMCFQPKLAPIQEKKVLMHRKLS